LSAKPHDPWKENNRPYFFPFHREPIPDPAGPEGEPSAAAPAANSLYPQLPRASAATPGNASYPPNPEEKTVENCDLTTLEEIESILASDEAKQVQSRAEKATALARLRATALSLCEGEEYFWDKTILNWIPGFGNWNTPTRVNWKKTDLGKKAPEIRAFAIFCCFYQKKKKK
jgi:hypothetical protein